VAVLVCLTLAETGKSLADPDVWWHVRTGRLILDTGTIPHTDPYSFTAPHNSWVTTAWLSDSAFGAVWKAFGYDGIRVLRLVMTAGVQAAVWLLARRSHGTTRAVVATTGLVVLGLGPFLAERPQVLSYFFVCWLSLELEAILRGQTPALWKLPLGAWLWANVHGMWFLLPVLVLISGVIAWSIDRRRVPLAARCTLVSILAIVAAGLTPVGPRLAVWPVVVSRVAAPINEWQPTVPLSRIGLPLVAALAIVVAAWAFGDERPQPARVLFCGVIAVFGMSAYRNVAPALILLTPDIVRSLKLLVPAFFGAPVLSRWRWAAGGAVGAGVALAIVAMIATPPVARGLPTKIAAFLRAEPRPVKVLNSYNVGGFLTGEATPGAQVAIDGRTDIWSQEFVVDYLDDISGGGDWRDLVDRLKPDVAVLPDDSEVARGLTLERHWRVVMTDHHWQLLEAP
jgi:hypothetical protein